ncbi:hypothetical protein GCM10010500_72320 [Streptomyces nigrescens]|nr:hypothetical protein GCM10010500_72320 [Streptomyces libani subsp. libani]
MVGIVEEEDQVTEADQGIGAGSGSREVPAVAVYVTDHMHTHGVTLERSRGHRETGPRSRRYFRVTYPLV